MTWTTRTIIEVVGDGKKDKRHDDVCPSHPGDLLREIVLPAAAKPLDEVAKALGLSRALLEDILAKRAPVTPEIALRLSAGFGSRPEIWLKMQYEHDLWHARRIVDVSGIPKLDAVA